MDSLKNLYKTGNGPSSSHTMGPAKAAETFKKIAKNAKSFRVTLYGSLAATGKGHFTDYIITKTFEPIETKIIWEPGIVKPFHTNAMLFEALDKNKNVITAWNAYSVGGGTVLGEGEKRNEKKIYPLTSLKDIIQWCKDNDKEIWEYAIEYENKKDLFEYLKNIWITMEESIENGLAETGILPGDLRYPRKAQNFYKKARREDWHLKHTGLTFAYALAVSETNASGGIVVTAPTCGSSGVVPAVLRSLKEELILNENEILKALIVGGIIGNLIKYNASISGAEVGCQGEVGSACSMAAAIATYLYGGTINQIEYAAEMAMEHHLGMTCDPVSGYVQIPCIERNAVAAERALAIANFVLFTNGDHRISFDQVIKTMMETGKDLNSRYKETSTGGLAKIGNNTST